MRQQCFASFDGHDVRDNANMFAVNQRRPRIEILISAGAKRIAVFRNRRPRTLDVDARARYRNARRYLDHLRGHTTYLQSLRRLANLSGGALLENASEVAILDTCANLLARGLWDAEERPFPPANVPAEQGEASVQNVETELKLRSRLIVTVQLDGPEAPKNRFDLYKVRIDAKHLGDERDVWGNPGDDAKVDRTVAPGDYEVTATYVGPHYDAPAEPKKVTCPAGGVGRTAIVIEPRWVALRVVEHEAEPLHQISANAWLPYDDNVRDRTDDDGLVVFGCRVAGDARFDFLEDDSDICWEIHE